MNLQKVRSIKIPKFDKDNYNQWKNKMDLFIRAINPKYLENPVKGPFVPMKIVSESVEDRGSSKAYPKGSVKIH